MVAVLEFYEQPVSASQRTCLDYAIDNVIGDLAQPLLFALGGGRVAVTLPVTEIWTLPFEMASGNEQCAPAPDLCR